ncbi:Prohibitin-2, mitochondrial [Linum perenne]
MNQKNAKKINHTQAGSRLVKIGVAAGAVIYAATNCIYNVEGGHRAIVFNRLTGVKNKVFPEGTDFIILWFERAIIYDVRAQPNLVDSTSGSRDLQMVYFLHYVWRFRCICCWHCCLVIHADCKLPCMFSTLCMILGSVVCLF